MQFISRKYKALRIVLDPISYEITNGKKILVGLTRQFPLGKSVQFVDSKFETNDKAIIEAMRKHPRYGIDFSSPEETVELSVEAIRELNEKRELAQKVRKTNPPKGTPVKPAISGGID